MNSRNEFGSSITINKKYLTIVEAANYLQCSEKSIRGLISSEQLEYSKVLNKYFIPLESIENLLKPNFI